jgi:hypothetical protein
MLSALTGRSTRGVAIKSGAAAVAALVIAAAPAPASAFGPPPQATTWYVSATAGPGGNGSLRAPFNSLAAVEDAAGQGDTIVVLPAPLSVPPLDGGIALKPGQRLVGGGPPILRPSAGAAPVVASSPLTSEPRVTNTSNATNNGDAVELADSTEVRNLVIDGSYRGGIYGLNVTRVRIEGNDVSGQNTSGTNGFLAWPPLDFESYTPGVSRGSDLGVQSGWAGIMVDGNTSGNGQASISGNYVHDGSCGNGIDIRLSNTAQLTATIDSNLIARLVQCPLQHAVQGISTQAIGSSTLRVSLDHNSELDNGSASANADSLFVDSADAGRIFEVIDHNTFANGIGGPSTNGFEAIVSNGTGRADVSILNSSFTNDPGDSLEEINWGAGSEMTLALRNVVVHGTTISGGTPSYAQPSGTAANPFNLGDCLIVIQDGANDRTTFRMDHSEFTGCDNNGLQVTSNGSTSPLNGVGIPASVAIDLDHSKIVGSRYYNLWVNNLTPLARLRVKVQDSDLGVSQSGDAVAFDDHPATGSTQDALIDLGGGALGSSGRNCIFGGALLDAEATGYAVSAQHDWWGGAVGPAPGTLAAADGGTISTEPFLTRKPAACL